MFQFTKPFNKPLPERYNSLQVFQQIYGPYENQSLMVCFAQQLTPKSRGTVTLRSINPYDEPAIDPNYFGDPEDIEEVVAGMLKII